MKPIRLEFIKNKKHRAWAEDVLKYVNAKAPVSEVKLPAQMFDAIWQHVCDDYDDERVNEFNYEGVKIIRIRG